MRRLLTALLIACAAVAVFSFAFFGEAGEGAARPLVPRAPKGFFGIDPQAPLTDADAARMKAGGIETVRWPLSWNTVQATPGGGYDWSEFDQVVAISARHGLSVLPILYGTPGWISAKPSRLPIDSARARRAWTAFLEAAVKRYGPGGEFWAQHSPSAPEGVRYQPAVPTPKPIRTWQVWNEANFFYFTFPASPQRYARLIKLSTPVIRRAEPGAKIILTGLFGEPTAHGARGMPAARFLEIFYRTPGIKSDFDGIALHPYAVDTETLEELVEALHEVTVKNHDRVPLYITEMGWGSQNDFSHDAFEQGTQGQVKELRDAFTYLLQNRNRLDLKQVYWFSWKDDPESCDFCDSTGLFHAGAGFHAKPAWHAFLEFSRP
jgi:hypothetical protein